MKQKLIYFMAVWLLTLVAACGNDKKDPHADHEAGVEYTCPMHPEVVSDKPGSCPTCGMDLVKKEAKQAGVEYTCPMHPEVVSDKPGTCPKCGMDLVKKEATSAHDVYTCPMHPEVVSDKPGSCPKCGMDLIKKEEKSSHDVYTCPMDPEVVRDKPGSCPICGMDLVKKENIAIAPDGVELDALIRPSNEFIVSTVPVTVPVLKSENIELQIPGDVGYDTRQIGTVSSRVSGRIEKLYVRYKYQPVRKGQKIMDLYSPELSTAQENYLFLLKNDAGNAALISASEQRLYLLGLNRQQVAQLRSNRQPFRSVGVYSNYSGYVIDLNSRPQTAMGSSSEDVLNVKEGMYLEKGQPVFSVYDNSQVWILLNLFPDQQAVVKKGQSVLIVPETLPASRIRGRIDYIEPVFRPGSKTITARVYFNNTGLRLPVGSRVQATVSVPSGNSNWLPKESVLSLGINKVVFLKEPGGFRVIKISTGITANNMIQVLSGVSSMDSVAANAQYLIDNQSFIRL